jgi:hypothetical protein
MIVKSKILSILFLLLLIQDFKLTNKRIIQEYKMKSRKDYTKLLY